jgi:tetratricopeptide (TPR) repeat protein
VALGVAALPLGVLKRAESIELLRKFHPDLSETAAGQIAQELGDLPLALHLAGSFLARYQTVVSPENYLARLREPEVLAHASLQGRGLEHSPTKHELHVGRTFAVSYERLDGDDETDRMALALLARAAYFAPGEPIPRALLVATVEVDGADEMATLLAADGLARLGELGLLEMEAEETVVLHRLLGVFVKNVGADQAAQAAVEETVLAEANRLNNAGAPGPLLAWQPHLRVVTEGAQEREDERAAGLCNTLGYHLRMIGDYAGARPYYERALAIRESVLGPQHPATALSLNNLGLLLQDLGDPAAARPYLERALNIFETVLGPEHPYTRTVRGNLASLDEAEGM